MRVGLIGMNYKLFDLEIREQFAKQAERLLGEELDLPLVVLSTCNRTEIYFSLEDLAEAHSVLLNALKHEIGDFPDDSLYSYFGDTCFDHLAKVTSGVDSVIFGESEIQRQVKEAYESACLIQKLPPSLHYMFQKCLKIGKEVRSNYNLPKTHVSIESTVSNLTKYFFQKDKEPSILFVGFSEINRKILSYFRDKTCAKLSLMTRSSLAAKTYCKNLDIEVLEWSEIPTWSSYDVVVAGSVVSDSLLLKSHITPSSSCRLVIDLGLPRNVDPMIEKDPSLMLFNIEEINMFMEEKQKGHSREREEVRLYVEERSSSQVHLFHCRKTKAAACA